MKKNMLGLIFYSGFAFFSVSFCPLVIADNPIQLEAVDGSLIIDWQGDEKKTEHDYIIRCRGCHLADGSGTPEKVPPLKFLMARIAGSQKGRDYLINVPGNSSSGLTPKESAEILNWMLIEFSSPNQLTKLTQFTEEEVISAYKRSSLYIDKIRIEIMRSLGEPDHY